MSLPEFTAVEEAILARAGDLDVTRKRIRSVWASAAVVAVALVAVAYAFQDWRVVTAAAVGYVVINTVERTAYGKAVLSYKSVIQKLQKPRDAVGAPILFFDIAGPDTAALRQFYNRVFGWQIGEAGTFDVPVTSPLQGAVREDPAEKRIYVGVDDVSATLAAAARSGGSIDQARFEVPGVAVLGLFRDPAGNPMGLIELESGSPKLP